MYLQLKRTTDNDNKGIHKPFSTYCLEVKCKPLYVILKLYGLYIPIQNKAYDKTSDKKK